MASTSSRSNMFPHLASSSDLNSGSYADIESASNVRLLKNGSSASVVLQGRKSSRTTTIAVVSLIISSLCLIGLALFGSYWIFVLNDGELMPQTLRGGRGEDSEVCLPCIQISPNPLDTSASSLWEKLDVRYDTENATEICCASTSAQFAVLFKLILQRQQAVKKLADSLEKNKMKKKNGNDVTTDDVSAPTTVSAHLVFKAREQTRRLERGEEAREQQWKSPSESPLSHVHEGLQFYDKRILVQTPGLYYVYCQFLYSPSHASSDVSSPHDVTSAYVRRYSVLRPAAPDFLLKSRHTRHDIKEDRHSSYAGGVFRLHSGDSLYVQVSRPDLISYDDVGSFFGLFRIGD